MLHRRQVLIAGYGSALLGATTGLWPGLAAAQPAGDWGGPQGYPTGWGPPGQMSRWEGYPAYRAGNYSGGFEAIVSIQLSAADAGPLHLGSASGPTLTLSPPPYPLLADI